MDKSRSNAGRKPKYAPSIFDVGGSTRETGEDEEERRAAMIKAIAKVKAYILKAREDPGDFIEFAMRTAEGKRIELAQCHREWHHQFRTARRVQIEASKAHGKCLTGNQRVHLADGRVLPAEMLSTYKHFLVTTYERKTDTWGAERARIFDNGFKPVVQLTLADGRIIERTEQEPVLTPTGFVPIAEIEAGDYIASAQLLPEPCTTEPVSCIEARLLGRMIADGTFSSSPIFTKKDLGIVEAFKDDAAFLDLGLRPKGKNGLETGNYQVTSAIHGWPFAWLRKHGLAYAKSHAKRVPDSIFKASNEVVEAFLVAYWDGNGEVSCQDRQLGFSSVSRGLLEDVQTLLLRLHVTAHLLKRTGTYKGEPHIPWRLTLSGINAIRFQKRLQRLSVRAQAPSWIDPSTAEPAETPITWLHEIAEHKPELKAWMHSQNFLNTNAVDSARADALEEALVQLGLTDHAVTLNSLRGRQIRWVHVDAVNILEPQQTWGITVDNNPVYVCENAIAHNTTNLLGFLVWQIGVDPNIRIKLFTQSEKKALERLQVIARIIESNKLAHMVFPNMKPNPKGPWHKRAVTVQRSIDDKDATLEVSGIMGSVEGGRADLIVLDDISDFRNSLIFTQNRDSIKHKVFAEILPMLEPHGRALSVATPHSDQDITAALRRNKEWEGLVYAVGTDDDIFKPLWEERWPRKALISLHREVGPIEYNRAYRCIAMSNVLQLIQDKHIQFYDTDMIKDPWQLVCVQAYDVALSQSKKASYFACVTLLYDQAHNYIFVADAWHDKLTFVEQARAIVREANKWQPNKIVIEQAGYQGALRQFLIDFAKAPLPVYPITHRGKGKEARMAETLPMFENKKIFFNPRLDPKTNPTIGATGDIVSQLLSFTTSRDKDLGDAFAYGVIALRIYAAEDTDDEDWDDEGEVNTRLSIIGG